MLDSQEKSQIRLAGMSVAANAAHQRSNTRSGSVMRWAAFSLPSQAKLKNIASSIT